MKEPFNCALLPNFFEDEAFIHDVLKEINKLQGFSQFNNDMFKVYIYFVYLSYEFDINSTIFSLNVLIP